MTRGGRSGPFLSTALAHVSPRRGSPRLFERAVTTGSERAGSWRPGACRRARKRPFLRCAAGFLARERLAASTLSGKKMTARVFGLLTGRVVVNISPLHRLRGQREISAQRFGFPDKRMGKPVRPVVYSSPKDWIDRLGGGLIRRFFDNLVLKKEKRRRRGLCGRCFCSAVNETSAVTFF